MLPTVTVVVDVPECTPSSVTEVGFKTQVVPAGAPEQLKLIFWLNWPRGDSVIVDVLLLPRAIVRLFGAAAMVKSGPLPFRVTLCGLVPELSVMTSVAVLRA